MNAEKLNMTYEEISKKKKLITAEWSKNRK